MRLAALIVSGVVEAPNLERLKSLSRDSIRLIVTIHRILEDVSASPISTKS